MRLTRDGWYLREGFEMHGGPERINSIPIVRVRTSKYRPAEGKIDLNGGAQRNNEG